MISAVQIFNSPNITFKAESFIVLSIIARTYLLHAYYRNNNIEYRYFSTTWTKRKFDKTKKGAYKYRELEKCIIDDWSPIDKTTRLNLLFLVWLRHEIEHQMTTKIDHLLNARFQSCCLNYNTYLKSLFWEKHSIDQYLWFSIQFSSIWEDQIDLLTDMHDLPKHIKSYVIEYDNALDDEDFNNIKYSYRTLMFQKLVNRKWQADKVIEFIDPTSDIAQNIWKEYRVTKEKEKTKYLPKTIIEIMKSEWYTDFGIWTHTKLRKKLDAKNPNKWLWIQVEKQRYRYSNRLEIVRKELSK